MSLVEHLRLRLNAFILKRTALCPALRRDLARYFITDKQACSDLMEVGRQQPDDAHLRAFDAALSRHGGQISFAQAGEDLIVEFFFRALGIKHPSYLDLGAFDPWELSNTARLHLSGSRGVNVEPNPAQFARFLQSRPNDRNVNIGVAAAAGTLTYFELDTPTLNTVSRAEAERCVREEGHRILRETAVPVLTLPEVLSQYCNGQFPDFLSVDIEGLDQLVVEVIAAQAVKPKVVCIETISYSRCGQGQKDEALIEALRTCGYMLFADTNINTIFVLNHLWRGALGGADQKHPGFRPNLRTPTVSVVLPISHGEASLREAINSILVQTFRDWELILVDDFSTDRSRSIAEEYAQRDARVRVFANTQGKGVAGALNTGLAAATGIYIAPMNQTAISLPERLNQQVAYLETHPDVSVCGTWVRRVGYPEEQKWRPVTDWDSIRCAMLFYEGIARSTAMWRRADFEKYHWRFDPQSSMADDELWFRIAETTSMANLPEVLLLDGVPGHNIAPTNSSRDAEISVLHRGQLQRIGLSPSASELAVHEHISRGPLQDGPDFVRQAHAWLDNILRANHSSHFLPEPALERLVLQIRSDICEAISWTTACRLGPMTVLGKLKNIAKAKLPQPLADRLGLMVLRCQQQLQNGIAYVRRMKEATRTMLGLGYAVQKKLPSKFKIGMAVMAYERPEYLELCLDSLFQTNLHDYDITFLISDDGSQDPRVREIINRPRDPRYKIIRSFTPKGPNNWGAAFNKAVRKLLAIDTFDIVGTCDTDVVFHPEWLDHTLKVALWAKRHHKFHILGPFSSFNSSDHVYHHVLGTYQSPYGGYLVKRQMSAQNYFYFRQDFEKLGYFEENPDDETLMTIRFVKLGVRNFCTATSYVEHIGQDSVLNQWRPTPVRRLPHGRDPVRAGWGVDLEKISPYAYYRYLKKNSTFGPGLTPSTWPLDVLIPVIRKDLATLPLAVAALRKHLRHPLGKIILASPPDADIQAFCRHNGCEWRDENSVLPIRKSDIRFEVNGVSRAGWIFKQILQLYADYISDAEHILLFDADTILLQPQKFEHKGRGLMLVSDEYHWPYFAIYQKIFGYFPPQRFSLIAHHLFVNRRRLADLRAEVERRHQRPLYQVIVDNLDPQEKSSFAEYETYGHWMLQNHRDEVELEYWLNIAIPRPQLWRHAWDFRRLGRHYRTVSYQHYHV